MLPPLAESKSIETKSLHFFFVLMPIQGLTKNGKESPSREMKIVLSEERKSSSPISVTTAALAPINIITGPALKVSMRIPSATHDQIQAKTEIGQKIQHAAFVRAAGVLLY